MKMHVHKRLTRKCQQHLFTTVKKWKPSKCASAGERLNKISYSHTVQYYSALKRNEILIHRYAQKHLDSLAQTHDLAFDLLFLKMLSAQIQILTLHSQLHHDRPSVLPCTNTPPQTHSCQKEVLPTLPVGRTDAQGLLFLEKGGKSSLLHRDGSIPDG